MSHDKASNVVTLYLRWIYCVVFIVFIPFYRCVKVFFFLNIHVIYFCILTYCTLGLNTVNFRIYTIMSHTVVLFDINAHVYMLCY